MKNFKLFVCAGSMAVALLGCGSGDKKGEVVQAQQCRNVYTGVMQACNLPNSTTPVGSYPTQGTYEISCPAGQFKLRNQCVFANDFAQACQRVGGMIGNAQGHVVCMSQRRIRGFSVSRSNTCTTDMSSSGGWGMGGLRMISMGVQPEEFRVRIRTSREACISFSINANTAAYESLTVSGAINPIDNNNNPWTLLAKRGYSILNSAQSGGIMSDTGDNFSMVIPAGATDSYAIQPQQNPGFQTSGAGFQPMAGYGGYGGFGGMTQPLVLEATTKGRNMFRARLTASTCEDGAGNYYTCY